MPARVEESEEYLAPWRRPSDDLERHMADIHAMAATGHVDHRADADPEKTLGWDDLLIKGAQLAKLPLNEEEPVRTETVIGPARGSRW